MCADWAGGPSTYRICLRPSADRCVLRLGSPFDYGARGFNVNTLLPLVEFSKGDANQKFPFLIFRFAAEGWGEEAREKCKEIFGFARASPRARSRRSQRNRGVRFGFKPPRAPRVRSGFEQSLISLRKTTEKPALRAGFSVARSAIITSSDDRPCNIPSS